MTKLISEQLIRDGGLESGKNDQTEIKPGDYIWTHESEDNPEKGVLFGKVVEKVGSDYNIEYCNSPGIISLLYQRVRTIPTVSLFPKKE